MRGTLILALLLLPLVGMPLGAQQPVVIEGATIVSPHLTEPLTDFSILVVEGRIQALGRIEELAIPSQAQRIDGRGKWVIPGLIEVHTHSGAADALSRALALGVTTAQRIGGPANPSQVEEQSNLADVPSPRLTLLTGRFGEFVGASTPATVDLAESEVRDMRSDGVHAIKIWQDDGTLWFPLDQTFPAIPEDAFRALVRTAHEHGMEVAVHAWRLPFFELAIDAGADRLIHPVADARVPDSTWDSMRENGLAWTTTMTVLLTYADIPEYARRVLADQRLVSALSQSAREQLEMNLSGTDFSRYERYSLMRANRDAYMRTVRENTLNARANGVSIVVGSDATIGVGTHIEMELMADAGLSPVEILTAATINGARALGLDDRIGTIEVGKVADLVLLNASPLADVTNLRDTFLVLKGGYVFDRATLTAGAVQ